MSKKHYIIPLFVPHEGCPHDCVFCNQSKITGKEEQVTRETAVSIIEEYLTTIDYKNSTVEVSFFGGTFTAIKEEKQKELLSVAKGYKDKGYIKYIRLSTRPDYISTYILDYLKEYGVDIIELGVQSLDEEVLKYSGRGHDVCDVEKASKLIKEYGFTLGHQLMIGLPHDTFEKDIKSVLKSIEMKPDIARIYPALVIKDTPMELMYNRGMYKPYSLEDAVEIIGKVYEHYKNNNVQVIRIGLQPTDNITEGKDMIAGPFHPAFRELVESKMIKDRLVSKKHEIGTDITIEINSRDLSKLYANKKIYFNEMKKEFNNINVAVNENIKRGTLFIKAQEFNELLEI